MRKQNILPLNLQLFAEDNVGDGTGGSAASNQGAKSEDNSGATSEGAAASKESDTQTKPTLEEMLKDKVE